MGRWSFKARLEGKINEKIIVKFDDSMIDKINNVIDGELFAFDVTI